MSLKMTMVKTFKPKIMQILLIKQHIYIFLILKIAYTCKYKKYQFPPKEGRSFLITHILNLY
jgi:hypothetical protein